MKPAKISNDKKAMAPLKSWLDNFWDADNFFNDDYFQFRNRWMPAVNIMDHKNEYTIEVAAPGLTKKDFNVTVDNGMLCISAEKESDVEEKEDKYTRREFSYNSFERSFTLPKNVNAKNIDARYQDGVLKISLKKTKIDTPSAKNVAIK